MILPIQPIKQLNAEYCGPACLAMVAQFFKRKGRRYTQKAIGTKFGTDGVGMSVGELRQCLKSFRIRGSRVTAKRHLTVEKLTYYLNKHQLPIIADTEFHFFMVVGETAKNLYIIDPLRDKISRIDKKDKFWEELTGYIICIPFDRLRKGKKYRVIKKRRRHVK